MELFLESYKKPPKQIILDLAAKLRPSNVDPADGALEELERVMGLIREKWPTTQIFVRADSAYAREEIFQFCEQQDGVDKLFVKIACLILLFLKPLSEQFALNS